MGPVSALAIPFVYTLEADWLAGSHIGPANTVKRYVYSGIFRSNT